MKNLYKLPFEECKEYENTLTALKKGRGPVWISGTLDAVKPGFLCSLSQQIRREGKGFSLVVSYSENAARQLYEECCEYLDNVYYFPARDLLFYSADIHGNVISADRIRCLQAMIMETSGLIITSAGACMDQMLPLKTFQDMIISLSTGDEVDLTELSAQLVSMGFVNNFQAEEPGQFAVRGGIIDIFPLTEELPVRVELWDTEIDSIRSFDPVTQRSIENIKQMFVFPATELPLSAAAIVRGKAGISAAAEAQEKIFKKKHMHEEAHRVRVLGEQTIEALEEGGLALDSFIQFLYPNTVSFLDYFPVGSGIFLDEPIRIDERVKVVEKEFADSSSHRLEQGYSLPEQGQLLYSPAELYSHFERSDCVLLSGFDQKFSFLHYNSWEAMTARSVMSYRTQFDSLIKDLEAWKRNGSRVVLVSASRTRAERLASNLQEYGLPAVYMENVQQECKPGQILVTWGRVRRGYELPLIKFVIVTESDMFGAEKKKKKRTVSKEGEKIKDYTSLHPGDYVIHENHGIGIFQGIEKVRVNGVTRDYIKITYADGGKLFTPVTQMDIVQKFASADAKKPKLNSLGSPEWNRTCTRVKKAVAVIARDLVKLYASRRLGNGFAYSQDTVWQREFEEMFPFEETADQLAAIEDTKKDMESSKIMDRLICGDVGYGKTEIALRAAFKAVSDSKQVVYLVPTTILAQQHYRTFVQRMKDFPIRVGMLSRFRTPAQNKQTIEELKKGMVDIVIGTHRVLSKDVSFKDLGLLIIDEEQRFGVTHKERIKQMKNQVDVLTLTATPIPRTLHMSMIGIRDMSLLEEAPQERVPIQTYVMEYNEELVREAIEREMSRGGQVYYVYNRVTDIADMAARIQALVPDAVVAYAHGQMPERKLDQIMTSFIDAETDVLVTTTIIETGLDISNVNTIIIHDADRFGLAQLYQLRGRVGRSNRTAYAFLMYKRDKLLKEEAEKRLAAIREFTELGSGVKIAMKDLEIRGAGNILGAEQSGHMEEVGYDLYCKLLSNAVKTAMKEQSQTDDAAPDKDYDEILNARITENVLASVELQDEQPDASIDINIEAYLPSEYVSDESLKLELYRRIAAISNREDMENIQDELLDRFGEYPRAVSNLLRVAMLKSMAKEAQITDIAGNAKRLTLKVYPKAALDITRIPAMAKKYKGSLRMVTGDMPAFIYEDKQKQVKTTDQLLDVLEDVLAELKKLRTGQ